MKTTTNTIPYPLGQLYVKNIKYCMAKKSGEAENTYANGDKNVKWKLPCLEKQSDHSSYVR